jgi:hypothetical protein
MPAKGGNPIQATNAQGGVELYLYPFVNLGARWGWYCQYQALATLPPGKAWYPLYRRLGMPQGQPRWIQKISPPPGFNPQTVQLVASRYTHYATPPHNASKPNTNATHKNLNTFNLVVE